MVFIGMMITMALAFLAQQYYMVGFSGLVVAGVMFKVFDSMATEGEGK